MRVRYRLGSVLFAFLAVFAADHVMKGASAAGLSPGSLDPTFGSGGRVVTPVGTEDRGNALAMQPDGKLVVVGKTRPGSVRFDYAVARYNTDGSLDTSFAGDGTFVLSLNIQGSPEDEAMSVAIQPDGKIVVAGNARTTGGGLTHSGVLRLNPDGTPDPGFGVNGLVLIEAAVDKAVVIQADGKIVSAGGSSTFSPSQLANYQLARLNPDGTPDSTFGTAGLLIVDFAGSGDSVWGLALQPDGKILAAGTSRVIGQSDNFAVARINTDGTLDATFGNQGKVTTDFATDADVGRAITLQPDGKIIVSGCAKPIVNIFDFGLVRYNTDGTVDTSFGNNGRVTTNFDLGVDIAYAVKVQTNGKIVAAGVSGGTSTAFGLVRYNPDGSLDASFGSSGKVETFFNSIDEARGLQIQPDGKIVAAGTANGGGSIGSFALARYIGDAPERAVNKPFDFDGDGRADIGVYRDGTWHIDRSAAGYSATAFGIADDRIVPADYDGDGKTDIAVFRQGSWYVLQSATGQFVSRQYGLAGDIPQPADYDGDGDADTAVFRPSNGTWYVRPAGTTAATQFGNAEDIPLAADRDGDGKADLGLFRPATGYWYWTLSTTGETKFAHFGQRGDIPVTGDFDGSGKAELAVFRPSDGTWYLASERGIPDEDFRAIRFGADGDAPVPADYDGDGVTDVAVFRGGTWYVSNSNGGLIGRNFGLASDKPVSSAALHAQP
jgi:uncharacterized delta-60 repeat protein